MAIANSEVRERVVALLERTFSLATLIHPSAVVSRSALVAAGCIIEAGVVVQAEACLGKACIVNAGAVVNHNSVVGHLLRWIVMLLLLRGRRFRMGRRLHVGACGDEEDNTQNNCL